MSAPLYGWDAPNAVDLVISWLRPIGDPCEATRNENDPLPFRMVNRVAGEDTEYWDTPVVSVHTFGATYTQASDAADITTRRMNLLAHDPTAPVTLFSGAHAGVQFVETVQGPIHIDYGDPLIHRFVARYRIGLGFTTAS